MVELEINASTKTLCFMIRKLYNCKSEARKLDPGQSSQGLELSRCMDELVYIPFSLIKTFIIRNSSKEKQ